MAALLGRTAASSTDATSPSKPAEKLRVATAVVPGEDAEIQGPWSLVGRSTLGRAGVVDSWGTSVASRAFLFFSPAVRSLPKRIVYSQPGVRFISFHPRRVGGNNSRYY